MSNMQPSPSLDYQAGDQPVPGYTLVRELGRGAMGVVWLARTDSGFEAALKIIDLLRGGGKKEYRGLRTIKHRKIRHGNLLTLLDYWLKDRDGKLIPDSDEIDATDSFFAPTNRGRPPAQGLSATIPHNNSATTAVGPHAGAEVHRAGTLVAPATYADESKPPPAGLTTGPGLGATVDLGGQSPGPIRRPVQLIVAMELGDSTLDVRQKQCQENRHAGVPVDELLQYMEHSARGLDYLHREGIVHRDVKPQNIMLVGDVAKVCDYGLIVTTDADLKATSNAFTPLYASPEAVADKPVTSQSDQYSLAVTYIELRTGKSPYSSETAATVYAAKETGKYDLTRIKEKKVRAILKRALASSPNDRFGSCSQFVRELEKAEHARSGWLWLATAAALVILVGVCAALAVPYLKPAPIQQLENESALVDEPPPPPPPPSIDKIRASRLAGHYDEATDLLAALGNRDTTHWAVPIERLHLEFSQRVGREPAPDASQWDAWWQTTDKLWADKYGPGAELVQLSALRIFTLTRLDPLGVSLSLPLTDEFATIASGRQHWDEVLSLDDQKRLESMVQVLNQRFVDLREPLTPAWKARFDEVWPQPTGGLVLVERVRERIQEKDDAGITAAEADLEYVAREFDLDSQPIRAEFDKVRSEVAQARQQNLAAWLASRLNADAFLTDSALRKETIAELGQKAATGASPLVQLARLEADMADREAAGQRYSNKTVDDLRDLAKSLAGKGDGTTAALLDHVNFLLGRAQLALRGEAYAATAAAAPELQVFANWPSSPSSTWQNKYRTLQAADFLLSLADASLPAAKESVLRLHDLRGNQVPVALKYISKARELVPGTSRAEGLYALVAAVAAQQSGNWQEVLAIADHALDGPDSSGLAALGDRRVWVEYVAAYAASKHKDAAATTANSKALARFAAVLDRLFKDDDAEGSDDGSLYQNVVVPALELPLNASALSEADKGHLASIYAAKARLLERDQYLSLIGMVAEGEDEYGRTIQEASQAYSKAHELRPVAQAAAGYGRTLLKLPREMFNAHAKNYLQDLTSLVERYDPERNAQDPTLRLMDGWVSWRTGLNEPTRAAQREKVAEALRHYRFAVAETAGRDPYLLHSLLMTYTSNAHVRAAFCTDVAAGDLQPVTAEIDRKDPAEMTKTEHLLEAVAYARRAAEDQGRRLPEEAFITEGNGLEDLAYYCKQLEHYQLAIDAFQAAAEKTGLRSKVYPYLCAGRARYRWAIEPADASADQEARQERLRQAYANLQEAISVAREDDTQDKAEAHRWLALVYYVACHSGPTNVAGGDAGPLNKQSLGQLRAAAKAGTTKAAAEQEIAKRIQLLEQAWRQVGEAADMPGVQPGDQVIYLVEQLSHGANLAELLGEFRTSANAPLRDEVLSQVRTSGRQFLERAPQEPKLIRKSDALAAVLALERINRRIPVQPGGGDAGLLKLKEYESLFQGDDGRAELVSLLRHQATYGDGDALLERAAALAAEIHEEQARSEALGQCTLAKAERGFDKVLALIDQLQKTPPASRAAIARDLEAQSKQVADHYVEAERLLAIASGPDVVANLELLRAQPLNRLPNLKEQIQSELAYARLRIFVTSTANLRRYAIAVLEKRMEMLRYSDLLVGAQASTPFPPAALVTARPLHDFLKAKALIDFTPNERELLTKLEKKL